MSDKDKLITDLKAKIAVLEETETDLNNTIGFLESGIKANNAEIAELKAQLATAHDSVKSLTDLIISGDDFIAEEENATYILPSYKAWLKGLRAVIESEVK
jgi:hypothetical protein